MVGTGLGVAFVPLQVMALDDVDGREYGVVAGLVIVIGERMLLRRS